MSKPHNEKFCQQQLYLVEHFVLLLSLRQIKGISLVDAHLTNVFHVLRNVWKFNIIYNDVYESHTELAGYLVIQIVGTNIDRFGKDRKSIICNINGLSQFFLLNIGKYPVISTRIEIRNLQIGSKFAR